MIGQPQSRRRRAMLIAMPAIVSREPQGLLRPMEIVIEELQAHQCIEGGIAEGFGVCLAGEGTEPITQGTIESFDMYGARLLHPGSHSGTNLHREQSSMLITMLDGLCQADALGDDQARTPSFACQHSLAIGPLQDAPIAVPARASPGEGTVVRSLNGGGHGLLDQVFAQRPSGTGDHEATLPILHQASPPFPLVRLAGYALFFCTNDQNSSIST